MAVPVGVRKRFTVVVGLGLWRFRRPEAELPARISCSLPDQELVDVGGDWQHGGGSPSRHPLLPLGPQSYPSSPTHLPLQFR